MVQINKDATSQSIDVFIADSAAINGDGLAGLTNATTSLTAKYRRGGVGVATVIGLAALASSTTAWTSGGFKAIDALVTGSYRLDIPNPALVSAAGVDFVSVWLYGASAMPPTNIRIELTDPISVSAGIIDSNVNKFQNSSATADNITADYSTGYNKANSSIGAVTTVTNPVNILSASGNTVRKNVALANFMFKMVDVNDLKTGLTGLAITPTRSLDGGAFGAAANAASEVSNGWYKINLAAGDLNGDVVVLRFTATGAQPYELTMVTQPS